MAHLSQTGDSSGPSASLVHPKPGVEPETALVESHREKMETAAAGLTVKVYSAGYLNAVNMRKAVADVKERSIERELVNGSGHWQNIGVSRTVLYRWFSMDAR